ncbi:hypothetical protein D9M72_625880 [compost metagenome]
MTLPSRGSRAEAWDTATKDKQNRASNQRIETIPQEVSRLFIYRCFCGSRRRLGPRSYDFSAATNDANMASDNGRLSKRRNRFRPYGIDLGPPVSEEAF